LCSLGSSKASNEVAATKKKKFNQADHVTLNLITFQTLTLFFLGAQAFYVFTKGQAHRAACRGVKNIRCLSVHLL